MRFFSSHLATSPSAFGASVARFFRRVLMRMAAYDCDGRISKRGVPIIISPGTGDDLSPAGKNIRSTDLERLRGEHGAAGVAHLELPVAGRAGRNRLAAVRPPR